MINSYDYILIDRRCCGSGVRGRFSSRIGSSFGSNLSMDCICGCSVRSMDSSGRGICGGEENT